MGENYVDCVAVQFNDQPSHKQISFKIIWMEKKPL